MEFDRVLNAVDDLGMDPTGEELIDDTFESHWTDGTLIEFPPGTYRTARRHTYDRIEHRGIRGTGDDRRDVQFVSPAYGAEHYQDHHHFLYIRSGHDLLLENYTLQQGSDHDGRHSGHVVQLHDGLVCRDVELAGFNPIEDGLGATDARPSPHPFALRIIDRDGVGVVERYVRAGGGVANEYPHRRGGILVLDGHRGELQFVDCYMAEGGSHTIYGSHHQGCVRIEGGLYENNDNTNLRISGGGHPTKRSWVKDARIVIDTDEAEHLPDWGGGYDNTKGLEIESTLFPHTDLLVEDVDIVCRSTPFSQGLVRVHDHGSVTFRNLRVENHVDNVPLFVSYAPVLESALTFENVSFLMYGEMQSAAAPYETNALFYLKNRDGTVIANSCIEAFGPDEHGILLAESTDVSLRNTTLAVPGDGVTATTDAPLDTLTRENVGTEDCGDHGPGTASPTADLPSRNDRTED